MLFEPMTRPGSLAATARQRVTDTARRLRRRWGPAGSPGYDVPVERPRKQCLVCGGGRLRRKQITFPPNPELTCRVRRCLDCGFVTVVRSETGRYRAMTSFDQLPQGVRTGGEQPGREFHMARMALDILGADRLDVLLYGVGASQDNRHLEKQGRTGIVAVGDIMKLRDDEHFIDVSQPARRRFDIVIASEVIEHFRHPREDFRHLFEYASDDGLVVCGTDINDEAGALRQHRYVYYPDHTAYYTPKAIRTIAHAEGWLFDFRPVGTGRKRYVLFTRSRDVMERVSLYFGQHALAPMEQPKAKPKPRKPVNASV